MRDFTLFGKHWMLSQNCAVKPPEHHEVLSTNIARGPNARFMITSDFR